MNHYDPFDTRVIKRFLDEVFPIMKEKGCWLWEGYTNSKGYGVFTASPNTRKHVGKRIGRKGKHILVHRYMYELMIGPIPKGLQIDHLCRVPLCVRPSHLEAVTQRENLMRGNGFAAHNSLKTHCPKAHEYTPENTAFIGTERRCKTCLNTRSLAYYHKNRSRLMEQNRQYKIKQKRISAYAT